MSMKSPYLVTSAQQLEAIASPGRDEIIDAVGLLGPCSIPMLAEVLGRSRHSLYYHVRALRDCGLLRESLRSGEGRRTTAYYNLPGWPVAVNFDLSTQNRRRAILALGRARLRTAARGFEKACRRSAVTPTGPHRNLWATHLKGWMSSKDLARANDLLSRLIKVVGQGGKRADPKEGAYEVTIVLAPVVRK